MKVLFAGRYNLSENLNGPEKVAKRIFYEYSLNEKSVFAEYFFDGRKHSIFKKIFGFEKVTEVKDSEVLRFGFLKLLAYLFKSKPQIIHLVTYERFALICFLYKIFSKVKIIYNVHGVISYENNVLKQTSLIYNLKDKFCENIFMKYSEKLIFLSDRSVELYKKFITVDAGKIEIIPNGTDEVFYETGKNKNVNFKDSFNIVFAGDEIRKEKGFDFLMNTISKINFNINLFLIGKFNPDFENYKSNIKVTVTERMVTNDFAKFLEDKDVFVSASSYEQFSITAVEAMAAGLAPIVTAETGMSSYIYNEINGFVINYGDIEMFNKVLERLNSDRQLLKSISGKAAGIYEQLSWKRVFESYKALYR